MKKILVVLVMTFLVSEVSAVANKKEQEDAMSVYRDLVTQRGMLKNAPPALKPVYEPMITMTENVLKDLCKYAVYTGYGTSQNNVMESVKACYLGVGINKCTKEIKDHSRHWAYAGKWCKKQGL